MIKYLVELKCFKKIFFMFVFIIIELVECVVCDVIVYYSVIYVIDGSIEFVIVVIIIINYWYKILYISVLCK